MRIVAGQWRGRRLVAPRGDIARPTADRVREAWMSIVTPWLAGARVLDLVAGSGALGIEALSRGAASADFVENAAPSIAAIGENLASVGKVYSSAAALIAVESPPVLPFNIPAGEYLIRTPTVTAQQNGRWNYVQEWWWATTWADIYTHI